MSVRRLIPMVVLALAACGGDSTGPGSLSGSWSYVSTNLTSPMLEGFACGVSGLTVQLTHSGSSVTGTTTGGTLTCQIVGSPAQVQAMDPLDVNGTVNGSAVTFTIGDMQHTGTHNSGTITGHVNYMATMMPLTGTFTLRRK